MPGPVLPDQQSSLSQIVPSWLDPANASVFDPPWRSAMREAVRLVQKLTGLDDPQTAILATANPAELANSEASWAMEQIGKKLPRLAKAIKAYHGSPHEFPPEPGAPLGRFNAEKIGTGEGNQSFAYGHYSAGRETTAGVYRDTLVEPLIGGKPAEVVYKAEPQSIYDVLRGMKATDPNTTIEQAAKVWDTIKARARVVDNVVSYGKSARGMMQHDPSAVALYDKMLETGELVFPKGHMYELAIHADPEHLLDWDKPLHQQSPPVRQAIETIRKRAVPELVETPVERLDLGDWANQKWGPQFRGEVVNKATQKSVATFQAGSPEEVAANIAQWRATREQEFLSQTGKEFYENLYDPYHQYGPQMASEDLKQAGVPGVKYLDAGSRAAGEGTSNYVVFPGNEYLIEILKKYGLFLPAAAGALYEAQKTGQQAAGE